MPLLPPARLPPSALPATRAPRPAALLTALPDDVLLRVARLLPVRSLAALQATCRRTARLLARSEWLWREKIKIKFGDAAAASLAAESGEDGAETAKDVFQRLALAEAQRGGGGGEADWFWQQYLLLVRSGRWRVERAVATSRIVLLQSAAILLTLVLLPFPLPIRTVLLPMVVAFFFVFLHPLGTLVSLLRGEQGTGDVQANMWTVSLHAIFSFLIFMPPLMHRVAGDELPWAPWMPVIIICSILLCIILLGAAIEARAAVREGSALTVVLGAPVVLGAALVPVCLIFFAIFVSLRLASPWVTFAPLIMLPGIIFLAHLWAFVVEDWGELSRDVVPLSLLFFATAWYTAIFIFSANYLAGAGSIWLPASLWIVAALCNSVLAFSMAVIDPTGRRRPPNEVQSAVVELGRDPRQRSAMRLAVILDQ